MRLYTIEVNKKQYAGESCRRTIGAIFVLPQVRAPPGIFKDGIKLLYLYPIRNSGICY